MLVRHLTECELLTLPTVRADSGILHIIADLCISVCEPACLRYAIFVALTSSDSYGGRSPLLSFRRIAPLVELATERSLWEVRTGPLLFCAVSTISALVLLGRLAGSSPD